MSSFSGINNFGNLTLQNGQRVSFSDIKDIDGDGKISKEEFEAFLKENNIDTIELSLVDKNEDGEITEEEFAILEQKQLMQEAVNALAQEISIDFAGTTLIPEITAKLKDLIANYDSTFIGDVSKMAETFKKDLPENYEKIKAEVLASDPTTIKNNVVNNLIEDLIGTPISKDGENLSETAKKDLATQLDTAATAYMKSHPNATQEELENYLNDWLNKSDSEKISGSVETYQSRISRYGETIESGELAGLKECAKYLIQDALNQGITVKLGNQTVNASTIDRVLSKYTDGETLKADIQAFIDGLSTVNKKDQIIADAAAKDAAAADKAFTDIKGSEYAVDPSIIDYSKIDGYADGGQIYERGKGWSGSRDKAANKAREVLESDTLKSQMKAQIQSMLEAKGIPFEKIEAIFENVYAESINQTIDTDGIITGRGARGLSKKGKAYCNIKNLVDTFITTFNTNIAAKIDEMNKSNTDLDLWDIDYSAMVTDENGETVVDENVANALNTDKTVTTVGSQGADYYEKQAGEMIDRLKPQMLKKAKAMCEANGVEFNNEVFTAMFNNAKNSAVGTATGGHNMFSNISFSKINPKTLTTTFTTEFKTNYTAWVDAQKAKAANA